METRPLPPLPPSIQRRISIVWSTHMSKFTTDFLQHNSFPAVAFRCLVGLEALFPQTLSEQWRRQRFDPTVATPKFVSLKELAGHRRAPPSEFTALGQERAHGVGSGAIIAKLVGHRVRFDQTTLVFATRRLILAVTLDEKIQNAIAFREKFVL